MNGKTHVPTTAGRWAAAILIAVVASTAVYSFARSSQRSADIMQAAEAVRGITGYMTPPNGLQGAASPYEGDAVLYEASYADMFLATGSAKRLPDVSSHIRNARALFEEVRRALAGGAEWPQVATQHEKGLAELDAAKQRLAEKYGAGLPIDLDLQRPAAR